jgi:hypothetical protein
MTYATVPLAQGRLRGFPGILLSAASGGSDAPAKGATTSQLAKVLTSGVLVAQVTGTGRTSRVLSNELRLSRFFILFIITYNFNSPSLHHSVTSAQSDITLCHA